MRHRGLAAACRHVFHRGVHQRCKAEADAQLVQATLDGGQIRLDVHAECGQDVGRTRLAGDAAIAMFCDRDTCCRSDGAAAVLTLKVREQSPPVPQVSIKIAWRDSYGCHVATQGRSGTSQLFDRFPFLVQREQELADDGLVTPRASRGP